MMEYWHPEAGLQVSFVHALPSSQFTGGFAHPVVLLQRFKVQALLSLQLMMVCWHPEAGSQVSFVQANPSSPTSVEFS